MIVATSILVDCSYPALHVKSIEISRIMIGTLKKESTDVQINPYEQT